MRRREFLAVTAAALSFAWPACAQTNARSPGVKRIAFFHPSEPPEGLARSGRYKAYFDELNRLGFVEGQNLIVERYSALGQLDRFGDLAREIVASRPDVIFPISNVFINQLLELVPGVPMVGPTGDPVSFGFSTSLARPDRNFTGVVVDAGLEIWAKRVQLLLEIGPRKLSNVGYLGVNTSASSPPHKVRTSSRLPGELALRRLLSLSAETLIEHHMNDFLTPSLAAKRLIELRTSGHSMP
jgi:ABC transporter substrate binding protein